MTALLLHIQRAPVIGEIHRRCASLVRHACPHHVGIGVGGLPAPGLEGGPESMDGDVGIDVLHGVEHLRPNSCSSGSFLPSLARMSIARPVRGTTNTSSSLCRRVFLWLHGTNHSCRSQSISDARACNVSEVRLTLAMVHCVAKEPTPSTRISLFQNWLILAKASAGRWVTSVRCGNRNSRWPLYRNGFGSAA